MTLQEYLLSKNFIFDDEAGSWIEPRVGGDDGYTGPSAAYLTDYYNENKNNPYFGSQFEGLDPSFLSALHGKYGYIAPASISNWGMGGGHGTLMGLDEFYQSLPSGMQPTEEQRAARAAFEAKYPGYYQISPNQAGWNNNQVGFKTAGPSVGEYVERPNEIKYDPEYGYITTIGNDAVAGGKGGSGLGSLLPFVAAAVAPWAVPAIGAATGLGAAASGALFGGASGGLIGGDFKSALTGAALGGAGGALMGGSGASGFTDAAGGAIGAGDLGATIGADALGSGFGELGSGSFMAGQNLANATSMLSPTGGALGSGLAGTAGAGSSLLGDAAFGLGSTSTPSFSDYIKTGSINGSTPTPAPQVPFAPVGNGVGLTEAAQAGSGVTAGSALSRFIDGTATTADYTQLLGGVAGAGLGVAGANQQANSYENIANKFMDMGQPYRDRLNASYAPGFSMANQPDFMNALDIGSQAAARATSAKAGNPVGNPGAYADMQKYISGSLALPQLNTYRSQLGTFGQFGTNQAGTAMGAQTQAQGGVYDALGYGIGQATQPDNPYKGLLDQLKGFKLNTGWSS